MAKTNLKEKEENTVKSGEIFINRIKINNDNTASIYYRTATDDSAKEVYYSGKDQITEKFSTTFQKSVYTFCEIIPEIKKNVSKIKANVIKLDYNKQGFLKSALYSVKYAFNDANNAVININTPPLPIYDESMENTFAISGKDEELLHEIIDCAKGYINGETRTKQMKLVVDNTDV